MTKLAKPDNEFHNYIINYTRLAYCYLNFGLH